MSLPVKRENSRCCVLPQAGLLTILSIGLLALASVSMMIGPASLSLSDLGDSLSGQLTSEHPSSIIFWQLRLPRIITACLVGSSLAIAGVAFQSLFRNPLAEPYVIGASSGAALGVALVAVSGWQVGMLGMGASAVAAMVGAIAVVLFVLALGSTGQFTSTVSMLLAGVVISSLVGSAVSLLMFWNDDKAMVILSWLMGSMASSQWNMLLSAGSLAFFGIVMIWMMSRSLDAYSLGDVTAHSLGLHLPRFRLCLIVAASLATAAAVASAGVVGFVGLIAPHISRRLVGNSHAVLIPISGLLGACLMLVADAIARVIVAPAELPVGIITSILGCPFFLTLLVVRSRQGSDR